MTKWGTQCEIVQSDNPEDFKYWIEALGQDYEIKQVVPIDTGILIIYDGRIEENEE